MIQPAYHEWPKEIADIYKKALEKLDGDIMPLNFGPAHIVWADDNFDAAEWCLEHFDEYAGEHTAAELKIVKWSLTELIKIPFAKRNI